MAQHRSCRIVAYRDGLAQYDALTAADTRPEAPLICKRGTQRETFFVRSVEDALVLRDRAGGIAGVAQHAWPTPDTLPPSLGFRRHGLAIVLASAEGTAATCMKTNINSQ